jgi:hypothetical protein
MRIKLFGRAAAAAICSAAFTASVASAQLAANQTAGFAKGKNYVFTYTEQYDCVDEPGDDLNFNGILAQSDPLELQTPICQAGTNPSIDPTGAKINTTDKLYVLVPLFSVTPDTNPNDAIPCPTTLPSFAPNVVDGVATPVNELCGPALGNFFIGSAAFGNSIPDAFRIPSALDSGITVQCPNPSDPSGSCTMHASVLDISALLGLTGVNTMVPLANHSHIIDTSIHHKRAIWWQVILDLVTDPTVWPAADGSSGLTSLKALRAAQAKGQVVADVPTNFFLFFGSQKSKSASDAMASMPGL